MKISMLDKYVHCCFDRPGNEKPSEIACSIDVYFATTDDLISEYPELERFIDLNDRLRADRFHFDDDRNTWLFCHTLLRLVLASELGIKHSALKIIADKNNKPWLDGNDLFFNISHTRDAFVFAVSSSSRVGIDIEKIKPAFDFRAIIRNFFSDEEARFIMADPGRSRELFFLLWTRKEALLKALGTGIINRLTDVNVSGDLNLLNRKSFENIATDDFFSDYFIYSGTILDYYLSIAIPHTAKIIFKHLGTENIRDLMKGQ